jgi:hypothetical protein
MPKSVFGCNSNFNMDIRGGNTMKYSRKRILKALKIISNVCLNKDCTACPFGGRDDKGAFCLIMDKRPFMWEIGDECYQWKAIEQNYAKRTRDHSNE